MKAFRNIIFTGLCSVLLCGTVFCTVADRLGVDFPDWLKVNAKSSLLEGRKYQTLPKVNKDSLMDGKFQKDFEKYVNDLVPMRDDILLGNAAIQRLSINTAASVFSYDASPTYFNSSHMYSKQDNAIVLIPLKESQIESEKLNAFSEAFNSFARTNSQYNYYFTMPPRGSSSEIKDLSNLVSGHVTAQSYSSFLESIAKTATVVDTSCANKGEYFDNYYHTDHHWNMLGAHSAYQKIATAMGFTNLAQSSSDLIIYEEPDFWGAFARNGLSTQSSPDRIIDYRFDIPKASVWIDGKEKSMEDLVHTEKYANHKYSQKDFMNRYAEYFHGDMPQIVMHNQEDKSKGSLLIVGDSFTNCFERLYLKHYSKVYVYDPRHAKISISSFLQRYNNDIDDILFCESYNTVINDRVIDNLR